MRRHDPATKRTDNATKMKANLLIAGLMASALSLSGQSSETLPSVPRADGTGSSIPSMSSSGDARGSAPTVAAEAAKEITAPEKATPERRPALPSQRRLPGERIEDGRTTSAAGEPDVNSRLDTTEMSQQIRAASIEDRTVLLEVLAQRIAGGDEELLEAKRSGARLNGDARKAYRAAMKELRLRRGRLEDRLSEVKTAKPETWPTVRDALAIDYMAFWVAQTRVSSLAVPSAR